MRLCMRLRVLVVALAGLLGCGKSPTAPAPASTEFDPTAVFSRLAGNYSVTFQANENCPVPSALKVVTYDVALEPTRFRYLNVRVTAKDLVGDLWALAREDQGFTLRWNVDCEVSDSVGSNVFVLCGQGAATVSEGTIAGALVGDYRPYCRDGAYRFVFQRKR
jgi:hypothetical protein